MTFGERVFEIRTKQGITQDELAKRVGYKSRSTIAKIESDNRDASQSMIVKLAKALNTTPSYLMGWDDEEIFKKISYDEFQNQFENIQEEEMIQKYRQLIPTAQSKVVGYVAALYEFEENIRNEFLNTENGNVNDINPDEKK